MATFSSEDVRRFLTDNPQLTDSDIADLMDAFKVSTSTVAEATGLNPSEVASRYSAAFSPEVSGSTQNLINQINANLPTTTQTKVNPYSDVEQGFIDWLSSKSDWTDTDIANYITQNNVPLEFVSRYTGLPYSQVLSRYTTAAATKTPTGTIPGVPGVTLGQGFVRPEYTQRDFSMARATPQVVVPTTYADRALLGPGAPGASAGVFGLPGALMPVAYPGVPAAAARPAENVAPAEGEGMKGGGIASLASKGRYGDTMLAHISPEEAGILRALGGSGTINPRTGLPEFWNPLKQIRDAFENVGKGVGKILKPVAKVAPFVLPFIPGFQALTPLVQGLIGGGIGSLSSGKFNLKRGLLSGLATYGLASLNAGAATPSSSAGEGLASNIDPAALEGMSSAQVAEATAAMPATNVAPVTDLSFQSSSVPGGVNTPPAPVSANAAPVVDRSITSTMDVPVDKFVADRAADSTASGLGNLASASAETIAANPGTALTVGTQGYSAYQAKKEKDKYDAEQAAAQAAYEDKKRRSREFAESVLRRYPIRFAAEGGIMADDNPGMDGMKAGGLREGSFVVPADVVAHLGNGSTDAGLAALSKKYGAKPIKGAGDGMSDSIPTSIEGRQKARVANGEAVVPPEVVKKVGANRLYSMMDKVRQARTGTKKQGKQINPGKYMPA